MPVYETDCLDHGARTMDILRGKWTSFRILCALLAGPRPPQSTEAADSIGLQESLDREPQIA